MEMNPYLLVLYLFLAYTFGGATVLGLIIARDIRINRHRQADLHAQVDSLTTKAVD